MKNILDQLKELPNEFVVEMEQQKTDRWEDAYEFVVQQFNCEEEIDCIEAQGFKFKNPTGYMLENEFLLYEYKRKICNLFNMDCGFIYACLRDIPEWYNTVRKSAEIAVGKIVETVSFYDFLFK